jgi:hypothetical protein
MNETERRQRLREWLDTIYREIQDAMVDNHVFWEVQKMFENNSRLADTPSIFNQWMASNFIQAAAVSIRRQTDKNEDSISMHRFLLEVKQFPGLVSRDSVLNLYASTNSPLPPSVLADLANDAYDRYIGVGRTFPDPNQIQDEIDKLLDCAGGIKHYVDKRVAHYDRRGLKQPVPRFSDLEDCLALLEGKIKKYKTLLEGTGIAQMLPTFTYDWKAIFRFSWLDDQD